MTLTATDAIVLQSFPYGETSRIVRLLTRDAGVHSAIAKGALRPRSRYAVLEPFAEGAASLYIKATRDLQTLGAFELTRSRRSIGRDLLRFGGASLVAELVLRTGSEDPQPGLFEAVALGLDRLADADERALEANVLAVTWHVVSLLGFAPELEACLVCGCDIPASAAASFDYAAGGVRCTPCAAGLPGRRIPAHARAALLAFTRGEPAAVAVTEGHWRLLARYLEHHLLEGTPLRSLQFLATSLSLS
ncbi:MAG TPA: DNA repair protein RecO [Longimicrobiales bacterium]|nr:DNA repair protein RecO [Longimicrobiales bacterium]